MLPVYTIGHSRRSAQEFVDILQAYEIGLLADIRTVPRSRRNPQFASEALQVSLAEKGIGYVHLPALGGLRHPKKDSTNRAWRNESFRGYADYMQTEEFARAVDDLISRAAWRKTAIMCAEAVPWRCHRSLVADALFARGVEVIEILSATSSRPHELTKWAVLDGVRVTSPGPADCAKME
jgi:uncharacterized protein (DUF488 family)